MDSKRDLVKIADRATVHYEHSEGARQALLRDVVADFINEKPVWLIGQNHESREVVIPWGRVARIEREPSGSSFMTSLRLLLAVPEDIKTNSDLLDFIAAAVDSAGQRADEAFRRGSPLVRP